MAHNQMNLTILICIISKEASTFLNDMYHKDNSTMCAAKKCQILTRDFFDQEKKEVFQIKCVEVLHMIF